MRGESGEMAYVKIEGVSKLWMAAEDHSLAVLGRHVPCSRVLAALYSTSSGMVQEKGGSRPAGRAVGRQASTDVWRGLITEVERT